MDIAGGDIGIHFHITKDSSLIPANHGIRISLLGDKYIFTLILKISK